MSELSDRMELLKTSLATAAPSRIVTRSLKDFGGRKQAELEAGIYTIISRRESEYSNYLGRMASFGKKGLLILGQVKVAENSEPVDSEDAEGVMIDEIKAFVRDLPAGLGDMTLERVTQSAQLDHPYGWVVFELQTQDD